jgi:hypothetical protein
VQLMHRVRHLVFIGLLSSCGSEPRAYVDPGGTTRPPGSFGDVATDAIESDAAVVDSTAPATDAPTPTTSGTLDVYARQGSEGPPALDAMGRLWLAAYSKIVRINVDRTVTTYVSSEATKAFSPDDPVRLEGITVSSDGTVTVIDHYARRLLESKASESITLYRALGAALGADTPYGLGNKGGAFIFGTEAGIWLSDATSTRNAMPFKDNGISFLGENRTVISTAEGWVYFWPGGGSVVWSGDVATGKLTGISTGITESVKGIGLAKNANEVLVVCAEAIYRVTREGMRTKIVTKPTLKDLSIATTSSTTELLSELHAVEAPSGVIFIATPGNTYRYTP